MSLPRHRRPVSMAVAITAALLVAIAANPVSAALTWGRPRPSAAQFSWNPGKALAATTSSVLSAWASDCPPPKRVCATNRRPHMGVFVTKARATTGKLSWGPARRLSPGSVHAERATIAGLGDRAVAGWVTQTKYATYRPGARRVFWIRRSNTQGRKWGKPIRMSARQGRVDYPRVAITGSRVFAVWTDAERGSIRMATSTGGDRWSVKTIGRTTADAGRRREGFSGLPDIGASGQNVVITWYTNDQGRQVALTSATSGGDLNAGSTPTVLTGSSPPNGIRYAGVGGASDGQSTRVAVAFTTSGGLATRVWNGTTLSPRRMVATWPLPVDGHAYADGYGPAVLPSRTADLVVAFAGCRVRPIANPCNALARPARIDVLIATSGDDGVSWDPLNAVTDAGNEPYRTNAEPSLALAGRRFRLTYDRYQPSFADYRVWARSSSL